MNHRDLLSERWATIALFGVPIGALIVSPSLPIGRVGQGGIWAIALATMGTACVVNAFRCGRVHCYLTGPFFLMMALGSLLVGFRIPPFERLSWNALGVIILIGGVLLCYVPEVVAGRYREPRS
jgi:hypothetical protein